MPGPRMTIPTRMVLRALVDHEAPMYGLEIGKATGLPSGTIHPILARLEGCGWAVSEWERVDPMTAGRPVRRYYTVTPEGRLAAVRASALRPSLDGAPTTSMRLRDAW